MKDLEASGSAIENGESETKWYKTKKGKIIVAGVVGTAALIGIIVGATAGGSADSATDAGNGGNNGGNNGGGDNGGEALTAYEFPVEIYGVEGNLGAYPSGSANYPQGSVSLGVDNKLQWSFTGFADGESGGIYIYSNLSCTDIGNHWYDGATDGWTGVKWVSAGGVASGYVDVDEIIGGKKYADNVGHSVVVHNPAGNGVACTLLKALTTDTTSVRAKIARYPGLEEAKSSPSGYVFLARDNTLSWNLDHLTASSTGGIHIHEGLTCDSAGGHFYSTESDPWNVIKYTATAEGKASGLIKLADVSGAYPFDANLNHAVVVHSETGERVGCGVLIPWNVTRIEETLDEDDEDYYSVAGTFKQYPGGPETHPLGKVWLDSNNVLSWALNSLETSVSGGIHIHKGFSCDAAGIHHWDESVGLDPWGAVTYKSNPRGSSFGKIDVDDLIASFDFVGNLDRTVVIHDSKGARVACAELTAREDYGVKAILGRYPGGPSDFPRGRVVLDGANVLTWQLSGLEKGATGGIHIHQGTSCDFSQGHHYDSAKTDGWVSSKWTSTSAGFSRGMVTVNSLEGAYPFERNVGKVVVIHDSTGKRVACGKLNPYVFYPERPEDGVADYVAAFSAVGVFDRYPGYNEAVPSGKVSLDSDNILSFQLSSLAPSITGGIHIHEGTSCSSAGGHHYSGAVDGWTTESAYSSTASGEASGTINVSSVTGGLSFIENLDHVVVVHDKDGARIACAKLRSAKTFGMKGEMMNYPGNPTTIIPEGRVVLSKNNIMRWYLTGLEPSATGGIHIHAGVGKDACANSGVHWFLSETDPWNTVKYTSTKKGLTRGVIALDDTKMYPFIENINHAVVVHAENGTRIGCAVLDTFVYDLDDDEIDEQDNDDMGDEFALTAEFIKLSDYTGSETVEGSAVLNEKNELSFSLSGLVQSATGGFHIHKGRSCNAYDIHWFTGEVDPWKAIKWVSDANGNASATVKLQTVAGVYGFAGNIDHAVVIHATDGKPMACGILSSQNRYFKVMGNFENYPGSTEENFPKGSVALSKHNLLAFSLFDLERDAYHGFHIHEGLSCKEAGKHWYTGDIDGWNGVKVLADSRGESYGLINIDRVLGAKAFDENAYHAVVVHDSLGARIACATLSTLRVGPVEDEDEEVNNG